MFDNQGFGLGEILRTPSGRIELNHPALVADAVTAFERNITHA